MNRPGVLIRSASPTADDRLTELVGEGRPRERPAPLPQAITGKQFLDLVVALANRRGWRVHHARRSTRSAEGFPRLLMVRRGVVVAAELKLGREFVTAEQEAWLQDLAAADVLVFVWRPADWPTIVDALSGGG